MTAKDIHAAPRSAGMNGVLFLLSLSVLINYIDRSNLSIAADLIKGGTSARSTESYAGSVASR